MPSSKRSSLVTEAWKGRQKMPPSKPRLISGAEAALIWKQLIDRHPELTYKGLLERFANSCVEAALT